MNIFNHKKCIGAAFVFAMLYAQVAYTAIFTWTGMNSNFMSNSSNWVGGSAPTPNAANQLIFPGTAAHFSPNNDISSFTLNSLLVSSTTAYTLVGNSYTFVTNGPTQPSISVTSGTGHIIFAPIDTSTTLSFNTDASTDLTCSGIISASSGSIVKQGAGTLILSASNSIGSTQINSSSGTLALDGSGSLGSGPLVVGANSIFDISAITPGSTSIGTLSGSGTVNLGSNNLTVTQGAAQSFGGVLTGTGGSLTKAGAASLTLSNTSTYTGGTTINAGTLQITGSIQGNVTVNGGTFDVENSFTIGDLTSASGSSMIVGSGNTLTFGTSNSTSFDGVISSNGTLVKQNSGTFNVTAANTFTGIFNVNAGTLNISSSGVLPSTSTTNIASGAFLTGTGTLGVLNNYGTVSPGDSIGTLTLTGNYLQASGSTLIIAVNPVSADFLDVSGSATIEPDATLSLLPASGTYPVSKTYTVLFAEGGLTGTFTNVTNNLPTIKFSVDYTPNAVILDVLVSNFASVAAGGNIGSVAAYLDSLSPALGTDLANVIAILRFLDQPQLNQALNQLHPALYKDLILAQQENGFRISKGITYHLDELINTHCLRNIDRKRKFELWGDIYGDWTEQNNRHGLFGYHSKGGGALLGADYSFTNQFLLGLLGAYSYSDVHMSKSVAKGHINSGYGALYALLHNRHAFVDLAIIGGFDLFHAFRKIQFAAESVGAINRRARTAHDGWNIEGHIDGGFIIDQWKVLEIRPFLSFDYQFLHEDGFKEKGAQSINLKVRASDASMLRSEAGINLSRCFRVSHGKWIPQVRFSAVRENRFSGRSYRSNFVGQPGSFVVRGLYPTRTLFSPGAGLTGTFFDEELSLSLYYDGEFGDGYSDQTGRAEFSFLF
jgi:fibronectin-binding autotransporter adhesin